MRVKMWALSSTPVFPRNFTPMLGNMASRSPAIRIPACQACYAGITTTLAVLYYVIFMIRLSLRYIKYRVSRLMIAVCIDG
jgi:hypothetical protein